MPVEGSFDYFTMMTEKGLEATNLNCMPVSRHKTLANLAPADRGTVSTDNHQRKLASKPAANHCLRKSREV